MTDWPDDTTPPPLHDDLQPFPDVDEDYEQRLEHNRRVRDELDRLRIRADARAKFDAEQTTRPDTGHFHTGAQFILDRPTEVVPIWGTGTEALWTEGEALMLCGPPGVGKTTIAAQVLRARLGLDTHVLGLPVQPTATTVLYLAMDRPAQIQRALGRIFTDDDRDTLHEHLQVHAGPPPVDLAVDPAALLRMAEATNADTIVVDSLKDAFLGISEDGPAAAYNRARQTVTAAGLQLLELHHLRKNGPNGTKPRDLADIYGSAWLTAGAGSVVLLAGEPGDPIVELRHLKQPADTVGPLRVLHDNVTGRSSIYHSADLVALARSRGSITAKAAASALFDKDNPTPNEVEKARRRLNTLTDSGHLTVSRPGDQHTGTATTWAPLDLLTISSQGVTQGVTQTTAAETVTTPSRTPRTPEIKGHAGGHGGHAPGGSRTHPPLEGGEGAPHTCLHCHEPLIHDDGTGLHPTCEAVAS